MRTRKGSCRVSALSNHPVLFSLTDFVLQLDRCRSGGSQGRRHRRGRSTRAGIESRLIMPFSLSRLPCRLTHTFIQSSLSSSSSRSLLWIVRLQGTSLITYTYMLVRRRLVIITYPQYIYENTLL